MILANDLRKAVLQAAIQGRIVDQRPEEGTGEELYAQIQAKKAELIKQGVVKREKPLPKILEDGTPFDIPSTWKWVRLGDISRSIADGDHQPPPQTSSGVPFIVISNLSSGTIEFSDVRHVPKTYYDCLQPSRKPSSGDILFTVTGSYGIPVMVETEAEFCFQRHMALIKYLLVDGRYLLYALSTPAVHEQCRSVATGTAQKTVGITSLKKVMLPLPPLEEQKRISERLGRILPEIEGYASAEEELTDLRRAFPDDMRKSVLQYAMQGKLVEQRPEEGTGEELYARIQKEKADLLKQGKIKREKPLPKITGDEIPFDIPGSWTWVRFGEMYDLTNGVSSRGSKNNPPFPVLRLADLSNDVVDTSAVRTLGITQKEIETHLVRKNDLILIRVNGSKERVAKAFLYTDDAEVSYCDHLFCGHPLMESLDVKFIQMIFNCEFNRLQLRPEIKTTAGQNTISQKSLKKTLIPLPPLAEQHRIVDKLEQILPHIDGLEDDE